MTIAAAAPAEPAEPKKEPCPLTPYQLAVLEWVGKGKRDYDVALIMGNTTEGAICQHVKRIMERLGANSRAGAVGIAYRKGWVK